MEKGVTGYLTCAEAGQILGLSQPQVWQLVQNKWAERCIRVGTSRKKVGMWLIPRIVVEEYVPRRGVKQKKKLK